MEVEENKEELELALNQRGLIKSVIKDNSGAVEDYSKAIELNPKNADNYFGRGNVYRDMKNYKMAIVDFSYAIKYDAGNGDLQYSFFNRAMIKKEIGEDFCQDLKKACELDSVAPGLCDNYNNLCK